jgi:hypothetical protein
MTWAASAMLQRGANPVFGNHVTRAATGHNRKLPVVKHGLNLSSNSSALLHPLNASAIFLAYTRIAKGISST